MSDSSRPPGIDQVDYLTDEGLDALAELVGKVLRVRPLSAAAMCLDTLVKNLRAERAARAADRVTPDPGRDVINWHGMEWVPLDALVQLQRRLEGQGR